jgi:hypothetical protein
MTKLDLQNLIVQKFFIKSYMHFCQKRKLFEGIINSSYLLGNELKTQHYYP